MDCDRYKLFVGGISRETSEESLKQHFSKYGAVLGALVAKEKVTGQPRGFGFVRFANAFDVDKALTDTHYILGRAVDVKKAIPKHEHMRYQQPNMQQPYVKEVQHNNGGGVHDMLSNGNNNNYRTKKLFVGGLSSETTEEEFKTYFEKFGKTTDVVVMHDSVTNRPRGFGFVTYDSENSVEIVMQSHFHELSNKRVEVKRAIPKEGIQSSNGGNNNLPPTYSSFKATPYVPESNGYEMFLQYPPPVFGYHQGLPGFHYPYGYPVTAQGPNLPWNNQIMLPTTGFYCHPPPPPPPPPTNVACYLPYMNGFDPTGMSVNGFNAMPWPVAGDGVGVIIPRLEDLKLPSQAHERMNGGNMVKPLPNGTYR